MKQVLSEKHLRALRRLTGRPYHVALVRGNWHDQTGRWCEAYLPQVRTDDRPGPADVDWVNRDTGTVQPMIRKGQLV